MATKEELIARIQANLDVVPVASSAPEPAQPVPVENPYTEPCLFAIPIAHRDEQLAYMHVPPAPDSPDSQCVACAEPIRWAVTQKNQRLPVNPDGMPHGKTCREAEKWLT